MTLVFVSDFADGASNTLCLKIVLIGFANRADVRSNGVGRQNEYV